MRGPLLAGMLLWAVAAQASPSWKSLWRTPDQRAQQLLQQGKAAEASRLFRDPRRKAYAELQAGNFQQAAQDFNAFNDSDAQYNRGNALARAGRLQDAIRAYDAALARDPGNRDARHNRELVAKALQQQPPKPPSATGKGQQGNKDQSGQGQSGQSGQKQHDHGQQNKPTGNTQQPSSNSAAQAGKPGQNPSDSAQSKPGGQAQPQPGQQANQQQAGQPSGSRNTGENGQQKPADEATQARRDAAAGLGTPQAGQASADDAQTSERQLAESQWLRQIPDDPGGLLRRKFMIEHLIRQQGTQP